MQTQNPANHTNIETGIALPFQRELEIHEIYRSATISNRTSNKECSNAIKNCIDIATLHKFENTFHMKAQLRGGSPQESEVSNSHYSSLLVKLKQYQEKILKDTTLEREFKLFVEVRGSLEADQCSQNNIENETFELAFDIRKKFLNAETTLNPKVILLTGRAGIGKSLFCKHFQRELLSSWNQNSEDDSGNWFSIYMDFSNLTNPKSDAISETLRKELSLIEEEILLLRIADPNNLQFPSILFIFDGYEEIEEVSVLNSLDSYESFLAKNFYVANKIEGTFWRNAKFIITCREEFICGIKRKDLLFAPINQELSPVPGSFLQRKIDLFSDEQINCYLTKYYFNKVFSRLLASDSEQTSQSSSSRDQVKDFEKFVDNYELRETARTPFFLWILCQVLPDIAAKDTGQKNELNPTQKKILTKRFLLESFVNQAIQSQGDEKEKLLVKKVSQQIQAIALELSGYFIDKSATHPNKNEDLPISKLYPLITWDDKQSRIKFDCPLLLEYFVAKSIEEEINEQISSSQGEQLKASKELLLNKRLLTGFSSDAIIVHFLLDALKEKRLTIDQLMNLIRLTRDQENTGDKIQEFGHSCSHSPFAIAAANAITLLNAAEFDFSGQDLSNICIPGANLSNGVFESTIFRGANLQGVNFTGAYLKDANFAQANLKNIELNVIPSLKFQSKEMIRFVYSRKAKYLAVSVDDQTLIYENVSLQKTHFKEIRKLQGYFPQDIDNPFSQDESQIITVVEKVILVVWDIASGEAIHQLIPKRPIHFLLHFNSAHKELMFFFSNKIESVNLVTEKTVDYPLIGRHSITRGHISSASGGGKLLLLGPHGTRAALYNLTNGKSVLRQRPLQSWGLFKYSKLSSDGKKIISGLEGRYTLISDSVRGHVFKSLVNKIISDQICIGSLHFDERLVYWKARNDLMIQDIAGANVIGSVSITQSSSFDPFSLQMATLEINNASPFKGYLKFDRPFDCTVLPFQGSNFKGLNLLGAIVNGSIGLSQENIAIFQERGNYGKFPQDMMRKLFPDNPEDAKNVREIVLSDAKLDAIHVQMIGCDCLWVNLQRLDLSMNKIGTEAIEALGNNKSWPNLQELSLTYTHLEDKAVIAIAENLIWKNLRKLRLAFNFISNIGAIPIGKNNFWEQLEVLDLQGNKIGNEGAIAIGENNHWKNLTQLDLSGNRINDTNIVKLLCSNGYWRGLKLLSLENNPAVLSIAEVRNNIENISSEHLEELRLPKAKFDRQLLQYLKYSDPKDIIEFPRNLAKSIPSGALNAAVIVTNTTWSNLKKLLLASCNISDQDGVKIGQNNTWSNLEELDLSYNQLRKKSGVAIGSNTRWGKLTSLNLAGNKIGVEGSEAIRKNTTWTKLQTLSLGDNAFGEKIGFDLRFNPTWPNLQTLNLERNAMGAGGITELSKSTTWTNLQTLNLTQNKLDDKGVAALVKNTTWTDLQTLHLQENKIEAEGARELSQNGNWSNLQLLGLQQNNLGAEGAAELAKNESWKNLQLLYLHYNSIGDKGAAGLSRNVSWTMLQTLLLNSNEIGPEGAAELGKSTSWVSLQTLDLSNNAIGCKGAIGLSANKSWVSLQHLNLSSTSIGAEGAAGLSKNVSWVNLRLLELEKNKIGPEGAVALGKNTSWVNLETLDLRNCAIGPKGGGLGSNLTWTNLKTLDLAYNFIKTEGAVELCKNTSWKNLERLDLDTNSIGDAGVTELSKNATWQKLQFLDLSENSIGIKGAAELSRNAPWADLRTLKLNHNRIEVQGIAEFCTNETWINLQELALSRTAEVTQVLKPSPHWPKEIRITYSGFL